MYREGQCLVSEHMGGSMYREGQCLVSEHNGGAACIGRGNVWSQNIMEDRTYREGQCLVLEY